MVVFGVDFYVMVEVLVNVEMVLEIVVIVCDKVVEVYQELLCMLVQYGVMGMMGEFEIFEVLWVLLWMGVLMGFFIFGVILVFGFLIGLVQVLIFVQEMMLIFVFKIVVVVVVFFLMIGYMMCVCFDLFNNIIIFLILG